MNDCQSVKKCITYQLVKKYRITVHIVADGHNLVEDDISDLNTALNHIIYKVAEAKKGGLQREYFDIENYRVEEYYAVEMNQHEN